MSRNQGGLHKQSPAKWLIGLLPVLAVTLAMVASLGGIAVAEEPVLAALTATASDGTAVKVEYSAVAIPEGTTLDVAPVDNAAVTQAVTDAVTSDGIEVSAVKTYDVTLRDADGNEVEPNTSVKATFTQTDMQGDSVSVYHVTSADGEEANAVSADALTVEKVDTEKAEPNEQSFTTDHFSVYSIVSTIATKSNAAAMPDVSLMAAGEQVSVADGITIEVEDKVKTDGEFVLKATINNQSYEGEEAATALVNAGYTISWKKTQTVGTTTTDTSYNNGLQVKVGTNQDGSDKTEYAVGANGGFINVAYTSGSKAEYTVTVSKDGSSTTASATVGYADALENPSFEKTRNMNSANDYGSDDNSAENVPGWNTTQDPKTIEVLSTDYPNSGFLDTHEFTAFDGKNFAEINAKSASALYQDVLTTPGQTMNWQFAHRARTGAGSPQVGDSDTMALIIAPLEFSEGITTDSQLKALNNGLNSGAGHSFRISSTDAYNRYTVKSVTQDSQGSTYVVHDNTTNKDYSIYKVEDTSTITQGSYTETYTDWWGRTRTRTVNYLSSSWNRRSGSITVPEGQYTSRFFFMAVSSAVKDSKGGDSIGNFVDNTWFSQNPLPPASGTVTLTVNKVIKGLSESQAKEVFATEGLITQTVDNGTPYNLAVERDENNEVKVTSTLDGGYQATYTWSIPNLETGTKKTFVTSENSKAAIFAGYDLTSTTYAGSGSTVASDKKSISTVLTSGSADTSSATVTITNEYTPATRTLTLKKVVNKGDTEREFTFTVSAKKGGADVALTVPENGNATASDNGKVTANLHDQESATITVPNGATVSIAETNRDGYTTKYTVGDGEATASTDGEYTISNMTADTAVTATNTIKPVTLTIQKEILGAQADLTKKFTFTVTRDGKTIYTIQLGDTSLAAGDGESKTIGGTQKLEDVELLYGDKVTITETSVAGYTTTYAATVGTGDNAQTVNSENGKDTKSAELTLNGDTTIVFTNTKENAVITGIKSAGVPGALTAVAVAAFTIVGGMALLQRNALESATTGAHTARGWHRRTNHKSATRQGVNHKSATRRGTNLKGASRQGSHMRGGDDA